MLKKIYILFYSFFLTVYFFFRACISQQNLMRGNDKIVVSLTSYGWRYNFVFLTIESIISQTVKPCCIYLWIYKNENISLLSKWLLQRQVKRGLVIKYVDRDTRSYKKLSYILTHTDCNFECVVTADDDVFYPNTWISDFILHPYFGKAILCNRGRVITFNSDKNEPVSYRKWPLASHLDNCSNAILPTGVSGICYPLISLDERISKFDDIEKNCPYADDIWYKLITVSNGYNSIILESKINHYPPVITSLAKGLEKINVNEDLNSKQFINSLTYFNLNINSFKNIRKDTLWEL
ncbi:hypothetical protein DBS98_004347 [Escherichia coli]|nr:hypothetical protein [Escherichia coli]